MAMEKNRIKMEIKIQSKKFVRPSIPTRPYLRNMKLSYIDQMSPPAYTPFVFYYSAPDHKPSTFDRHTTVLERSLSEVLTRYYPLAGRYIQDKILVECNDEGALVLEAEVNCQIDQLLQGEPDAILLNLLVPFTNEMTAFGPITLAIQINKFECGGLAIGICISHRVADGVTAFSFVNDWSKVCRTGINQKIWPSFDAGSFFPAKDTLGIGIPAPKPDGTKIVTRRFLFSEEAVSTLKDEANSCNSRVEVVAALIWKARIGASMAKHGRLRPCLLILSLNLRGKTVLPLRENSGGNLCRLVVARFDPDETKAEFENLATLLGDKLKNAKEECARVRNYGELMTIVGDSLKEIHEEGEKGDVDECVVASWCRFPFYEVDFGWGNPSWFSSVHKPLEIVVLVDTKNGDGIDAWVSLKEHNMYRFQEDETIINLSSSFKSLLDDNVK